jgi:ribosomal protein S18 acetylase RimI-like enzyme
VEHLIEEARSAKYQWMRLDTIGAKLVEAMALYRSIGFYDIPPYYDNPIPGAAYMELQL